ncbi:MAG: ABC transporter permease [Propionibacteriaceae bacterium]|jgi:rhamnose transport system permease protein|nr:ABC transporter permease [Propionibacteriaceae bacterium]
MSERVLDKTYYADYAKPLWRRTLINRESAIVVLLFAVIITACTTVPNFAETITIYHILQNYFTALMLALPMCLVMITGDIDISVGSMVGLSCSLTGVVYNAGGPLEVGMLCGIAVGLLGGLVNGLLVTRIGLPALAVTLGTMALFRGLAVGMLGTTTVTKFPENWTMIPQLEITGTGIPVVMIFYVLLAGVFVWLLHFTTFGRGIYAIGLNAQAATFSGVNSGRTRTIAFVLAGGLAGLGGVYWTLLRGVARGDTGDGLELQVIAAIVLGGVSVFGGVGTIWGSIAGVLLIGTLANALQVVGITADIIKIITGGLLIAAVLAGSLITWINNRRAKLDRLSTDGD